MAPARGGLKGLYRQRKKKGGVAKPSKSPKGSKNKQQQCTQDGGDSDQERDREEEELRRFDMDMAYGPCSGMTRLRRWERAAAMGLRPPPHLQDLMLLRAPAGSSSSTTPPPNKNTQ